MSDARERLRPDVQARWVIPPGQEALLRRMLSPGVGGWRLECFSVDESIVVAWYADAARQRRVRLELAHPEQVGEARRVRTERFALHVGSVPCGADPALVAAVVESVRRTEGSFEWKRVGTDRESFRGEGELAPDTELLDTELLALRVGLKPAVRLALAQGEVHSAIRRLTEHGMCIERLRSWSLHAGLPRDYLFAAPDARTARTLVDREQRMARARAAGDRAAEARLASEIGRLLGYPECCAAAHGSRLQVGVQDALEAWTAVRDAWVPRPEPRLNSLIPGLRLGLVSFEPCRFDCQRALSQANALAEVLERVHPGHLSVIERDLARPILIHHSGERCCAELDRASATQRIAHLTPVPRVSGGDPSDALRQLVRRWLGATVSSYGVVGDGEDPPTLVVDFAWKPGEEPT